MKYCRWCKGKLKAVAFFGRMPLVNYFPNRNEALHEKLYRLTFCQCKACGLAQIQETIPPEILFRRYHYVTGASVPLVKNLQQFAREHRTGNVLDIGSNDGTLLSEFQKQGSVVLGVEPATSTNISVPTIRDFFSLKLAKKIRKTHGTFDLVTAMHVLANIPDLQDFLCGVQEVLSDNGKFIVEIGSVEDMTKYGQFDSIYHEHYSYFSKRTLTSILARAGFRVIKSEKLRIQGGSWRITAVKGKTMIKHVAPVMFNMNIHLFRKKLRSLIVKDLKGKTVIGFGAPAKGVILLNYCRFGTKDIAYVIDSTPQKQGRLIPGVHIPVYAEEKLKEGHVDAILVLSWNYLPEILAKIKKFVHYSVEIIIPFPKLITRNL